MNDGNSLVAERTWRVVVWEGQVDSLHPTYNTTHAGSHPRVRSANACEDVFGDDLADCASNSWCMKGLHQRLGHPGRHGADATLSCTLLNGNSCLDSGTHLENRSWWRIRSLLSLHQT